jgi:hypothetical protein
MARLLLLLVIVLSASVLPEVAMARVYRVYACGEFQDAPSWSNYGAPSWSPRVSGPGVTARIACPADGLPRRGINVHNVVSGPGARKRVSRGAKASLVFVAPRGTTIVGIRTGYYFYRARRGWQTFLSADSHVLKGCYDRLGKCERTAGDRYLRTPPSSAVYLTVACKAARCPTTPTGNHSRGSAQALASLWQTVVVLEDDSMPTVGEPAGPLVTPGWKSGDQGVHFDAVDNTGVVTTEVLGDGSTLISGGGDSSTCDETLAVPCTDDMADYVVNTRLLSDGRHVLSFRAYDPAWNFSQLDRPVAVDNSPPGAPESLAVDGGDEPHRTNSFDIHWRNPPDDFYAPVTAAEYELCPASGGSCQRGEVAGAWIDSLEQFSVPGRGAWVLRLWLRDAANNADEGTSRDVTLRFDDSTG